METPEGPRHARLAPRSRTGGVFAPPLETLARLVDSRREPTWRASFAQTEEAVEDEKEESGVLAAGRSSSGH